MITGVEDTRRACTSCGLASLSTLARNQLPPEAVERLSRAVSTCVDCSDQLASTANTTGTDMERSRTSAWKLDSSTLTAYGLDRPADSSARCLASRSMAALRAPRSTALFGEKSEGCMVPSCRIHVWDGDVPSYRLTENRIMGVLPSVRHDPTVRPRREAQNQSPYPISLESVSHPRVVDTRPDSHQDRSEQDAPNVHHVPTRADNDPSTRDHRRRTGPDSHSHRLHGNTPGLPLQHRRNHAGKPMRGLRGDPHGTLLAQQQPVGPGGRDRHTVCRGNIPGRRDHRLAHRLGLGGRHPPGQVFRQFGPRLAL